ncbi:unnamed protein product, partial [Polarella glacialis]
MARMSLMARLLALGAGAALVSLGSSAGCFALGRLSQRGLATSSGTRSGLAGGVSFGVAPDERSMVVIRHAAKAAKGETIKHGDTVYIKVMTGKYIGEVDGTTKLEWVKARGAKKDKEHALTLEKVGDKEEPVKSGDTIMIVMPNGVHMDVL